MTPKPELTRWGIIVGLLIVFVGILDVGTTMLVLSHGGYELNPIVLWLMGFFGALWPIPKMLFHIVSGIIAAYFSKLKKIKIFSILIVIFFTLIALNNILVLFSF